MDPPVSVNCGWAVLSLINGTPSLPEKFTQVLDKTKGNGTLEDVYQTLDRIIIQYKPIALCMERQLGGGFQFGRAKLNEFVGIAKLCAYRHGVPVVEGSPAHLKMIITGHGQAPKEFIMSNIVKTFKLNDSGPEHECDAAGFALMYLIDNGWSGYKIKDQYTVEMAKALKEEKKARKKLKEERKQAKEAKQAQLKKKSKVVTTK